MALQVDSIPENIKLCDPSILPFLSPKVKAVCEAFPLQADEIVAKYGLNSKDFNGMLQDAKVDSVMRWKIKRLAKELAQEE